MATESATERYERLQDVALRATGVEVRSRYVDVATPPPRVHVLDAGQGPPVLMVHGGNSTAASWDPLIPLLADRFHLLMPDRPGCGLTTPRFDYRGVDLRSHGAAFLHDVIAELGVGPVAVVGNSMGGFFSMALAIAHPEMVSRLVLLGEPAGTSGDPRGHWYHRLVGTRGLNALLYATALKPSGDAGGARAALAKGHLVADPDRVPEDLLAALAAAAVIPGATRSWRTMVERVFVPPGLGLLSREITVTHALIPDLHQLTAPTLFLWGDRDPLGTPDDGRVLVRHMPDARLEVVADAGHLAWLDQPERCAEAVVAFLTA
jgi:pimeloyl-ACP methyl ester carboxylesterase